MDGRTLLRVAVVVACVALTALGYRNSNGDNSDAIAAATRAACKSADCTATLDQQSRGSFGHEYSFRVSEHKEPSKQVIVACQREQVLIGDWKCGPK